MTTFSRFNFVKFEREELNFNKTLGTVATLGGNSIRSENKLDPYLELYAERAAIYEYEGCMDGSTAQWKAMNDIFVKYLRDTGIGADSDEAKEFIRLTRRLTNFDLI